VTWIWLIRHAESSGVPGVAIGAGDPPLSDQGRVQAQRLAATMAARPLVRILTSDSKRALETARIVAQPHGVAVETTAALREIDFGVWEGRFLGDLWLEDPLAAKAWEDDIRVTPPGFGENLNDLERRVGILWASMQPLPAQGEIAFVGHQGSLAVLRAAITGDSVSNAFATRLELAGAVALDLAAG
jgi:broad specificity phosphatase PhoE